MFDSLEEEMMMIVIRMTVKAMGYLHLAKPCLWQDGSAEQGEGVVKVGLEGGWMGGSRPTHVSQQERKKPGVATVSLYSQAHQVNS